MSRKGSAFAGLSVAIVTPFQDGQVDVKRLREQGRQVPSFAQWPHHSEEAGFVFNEQEPALLTRTHATGA